MSIHDASPDSQSGPTPGGGGAPFEWPDGQGQRWTVEAHPARVSLRSGDVRFDIPRARFSTDIYVSPMGQQVVLRFSGPDQDVGFLVSKSDAAALFGRIEVVPVTPDALAQQEAREAAARRPTWPEMTATSVWALICAALAFLPYVGFVFALIAAALLWRQRKRTQPTPATRHIRKMAVVTLGLLVWGIAVCMLSTWTWTQPFPVEKLNSPSAFVGGQDLGTPLRVVLVVVVVLASLSIHEAAHAISAWWCGDDLARSLGRVTLNPKAHIDLFGTVILPTLLAVSGLGVFGYAKPVPVQLAGVRNYRRAHILISIAGPGSNLLLAAAALSVLLAIGCVLRYFAPAVALLHFQSLAPVVPAGSVGLGAILAMVIGLLKLTFIVNIILALFNLIPIPPLDGSWVLEHLFPQTLGQVYARLRPYGFMLFLLLYMTHAFRYLLAPAWQIIGTVSGMLSDGVLFSLAG